MKYNHQQQRRFDSRLRQFIFELFHRYSFLMFLMGRNNHGDKTEAPAFWNNGIDKRRRIRHDFRTRHRSFHGNTRDRE